MKQCHDLQKNKHQHRESKGIFKQITDDITPTTSYEQILQKYPDICLQHGKKIKEYIHDVKMANRPKYRNWAMNVEYHYGDTGTGKSKYAYESYGGYNPDTHYVLRKANGENNVWFDGYDGQETIIIDDFSPKCYRLSFMLNLLDRYAMKVDIKGGTTEMLAKNIIITSNYSPETIYTNIDCKEHKKALLRRINYIKEYKKDIDTTQEPITNHNKDIDEEYTNNIIINNNIDNNIDDNSEDDDEIVTAPPVKIPPFAFKCHICDQRFQRNYNLKEHFKTHYVDDTIQINNPNDNTQEIQDRLDTYKKIKDLI